MPHVPGRLPVDVELRDLAVLATLALLFVMTLELMALTRERRALDARLAAAHREISGLRERLVEANRPPTQFARMRMRAVAVDRFARLRLATPRRRRLDALDRARDLPH
jgi:hypothetical protein